MWMVLFALLAGQGVPPIVVPAASDWIGTLEFTDSRGLTDGRAQARLVISDTGAVSGSWRTLGGSSGSFEGTLKAGQFKLQITFHSGAEQEDENGNLTPIALERCNGTGTFTGTLMRTSVIRLTSPKVVFDTQVTRARGTQCEDIRNVIWLLQPREH